MQGWLKKRSRQEGEVLRELFSSSFPELYRFTVRCLEYKIDMLEAFVIMQSINMLQGLIPAKVDTRNLHIPTILKTLQKGDNIHTSLSSMNTVGVDFPTFFIETNWKVLMPN
jgi:hypothetical protein